MAFTALFINVHHKNIIFLVPHSHAQFCGTLSRAADGGRNPQTDDAHRVCHDHDVSVSVTQYSIYSKDMLVPVLRAISVSLGLV